MEAHEQLKNGNVLKFLKNYWFIVAFIIGVAISWSEMRGTIIQNVKDIIEVEASVEINTASVSEIKLKYAKDITYIKTTLETIKNK